MTICPFALATGTACPGCGMTRAVINLLKGDIGAAVEFHPLAPLILGQLVFMAVWWFLRRSDAVGPIPRRVGNAVVVVTALAMLSVWGMRLSVGGLPPV